MNEYQLSVLEGTKRLIEDYESRLSYFNSDTFETTPKFNEERRQAVIADLNERLNQQRTVLFFLEHYPDHPATLAYVEADGDALIAHVEFCWQEDGEEEDKANKKLHEAYEALVALKSTLS